MNKNKNVWKICYIFEKENDKVLIKDPSLGNKNVNLLNQIQNISCVYWSPYIIFMDNNTKLLYFIKDNYIIKIIQSFQSEIFYFKSIGSYLFMVGSDYDNSKVVINLKIISCKDTINDSNIKCFKLFNSNIKINNFTICSNLKSFMIQYLNKKYKIYRSNNIFEDLNYKETEVNLDSIVDNLFLFYNNELKKTSLYFTNENGLYFLESIEKNTKASLITNKILKHVILTNNNDIIGYFENKKQFYVYNYLKLKCEMRIFVDKNVIESYYFKNYLVLKINNNKLKNNVDSILIYDLLNRYVALNLTLNKISFITPGVNELYVCNLNKIKLEKELLLINELSDSEKLKKFFKRSFYEIAYNFTKNNGYDKKIISDVCKCYADYSFKNGKYELACQEYIKTIKYLEPSYVIKQFLDVGQTKFVIKYLEELHFHPDNIADNNHTSLLLNCLLKENSIDKFKKWFFDMSVKLINNKEYIKTCINILLEIDEVELAKEICLKFDEKDLYIRIMIESINYKETLDHDEKIKLSENILKFILSYKNEDIVYNLLIQYCKNLYLYIPNLIENYIIDYIKNIINNKEKDNEKINFDELFSLFDNFTKLDNKNVQNSLLNIFNFLYSNSNKFENQYKIANLYIKFYIFYYYELSKNLKNENNNKNQLVIKEEIKRIDSEIQNLLKNKKLERNIEKYNLLVFFSSFDYNPGIIKICEILDLKIEMIRLLLENDKIKNAIKYCSENSVFDEEIWLYLIDFICEGYQEEDFIEYLPEIFEQMQKCYNLSDIMILDILSKKKNNIKLKHIKQYFIKKLTKIESDINDESHILQENDQLIKKKEEEYNYLATEYQNISKTKCDHCDNNLYIPSVHFICKHSFHENCWEGYDCLICYYDQKNVIDARYNYNNNIIDDNNIKNDLNNYKNKFDIVTEYLGKYKF